MLFDMKNDRFPLISNTIIPKVTTLLYPVQHETLCVIYWNLHVVLKCYIEKSIGVYQLYTLTCCIIGRYTCERI